MKPLNLAGLKAFDAEEYSDKCLVILEWVANGDAPDSFDDEFVDQMMDRIQEGGILSEKQMTAIDNILEGFGFDP